MSDQQTFRIHNEPLSFHDRVYIALVVKFAEITILGEKRSVSCDIQVAWDIAKAASEWREKMAGGKE